MSRLSIRLAGVSLSMLLFVSLPSTAALFTGPFDTAVAGNPTNVTSGDVDDDGDLDLVVCHRTLSLVTILLNDGGGGFAPAPAGPLAGVPFPVSAGLGLFNGDQDAMTDLIVVGGAIQGMVFVLLGDGAGGFHLSGSFDVGIVGEIGRKVAVADFTGDGRDDLVFASGRILLGRGDGTFAPAVSFNLTSSAFDVIDRDFDGDGRPDVAFMSGIEDQLRLFLWAAGGGFFEATGSPVDLPGEPESLAAGDFDGDNDLDLAVTDIFGMGTHLLLNEGGGPTALSGFLGVRAGYPRGIAAADFDGDGRDDLAVGSNNSADLSILLAGDGGLMEIDDSPLRVTGGAPISIVTGDLDGDGDPDLAAADFQGNRIAVFVNTPARVLEVPIDIQPGNDDNVIRIGSPGVVTVAILSTEEFDATSVDPATVLLAGAPVRRTPSGSFACRDEDVDADGRVDLVCKVEKEAIQLGAGDTVATLEAVTSGATRIRGRDNVRVIAH